MTRSLRRARLLLVDDNEVDFVITRKLLDQIETCDYHLDWIADAAEARRELLRGRHDLCLLDYQLGDRTGLDFLRELAHLGCGVPVVLITGRGNEGVDEDALALGAAGYLDKDDLDARELDRVIRYALRQGHLVTDLLDHNEELLRLHRLTGIALSGGPPREVYDDLAREVARATGFAVVALEAYDPDAEQLGFLGSEGAPPPPKERRSLGGTRDVVLRRRIVLSTEPEEPGLSILGVPVKTCLRVPIEADDEVLGVLHLGDPELRAVDSSEIGRAGTLAAHLATLISRTGDTPAPGVPARSTPVETYLDRGVARRRTLATPSEGLEGIVLARELETVHRWLGLEARERGLDVDFAFPADPELRVPGKPQQLRQILTALLGTVLRMASAGATIRVRTLEAEPTGALAFELSCDGLGIDHPTLAQWRHGAARDLPSDDRGAAGLFLCRQLARRVGGELEVVADPHGRARLRLALRFAPASEGA